MGEASDMAAHAADLGTVPLAAWAGFLAFVLAMLALDLGVFNRKAHVVRVKEALVWSGVWIALAMAFGAGLHFWLGREAALAYLTGYVVEKALSVDNIFVFVMIFAHFRVPAQHQHKVLFWGVLGALVMRAAFIVAGVELIARFHWVLLVFGAFLVVTAVRMLRADDAGVDPEKSRVLRVFRRFVPVTSGPRDGRFLVREGGRLMATPLMLTVVLVEASDLLFAVDSIPAILSISRDPFIVFTSNVFAIMGLRSLYFLLAGVMDKFVYLRQGLAAILAFVGAKMLVAGWWEIPMPLSLGVIAGVLALAIAASLVHSRVKAAPSR